MESLPPILVDVLRALLILALFAFMVLMSGFMDDAAQGIAKRRVVRIPRPRLRPSMKRYRADPNEVSRN